MDGKSKCKILKEIRRKIAAENDIAYVTSECRHQGDCAGTCPKCESEIRYLEEQLRLRQSAGKRLAVAGIAAALMVTASGCDLADILNPATGGTPLPPVGYGEQLDGELEVKGELVYPTEETEVQGGTEPVFGGLPLETEPLMGDPLPDPEPLMGDLSLPQE